MAQFWCEGTKCFTVTSRIWKMNTAPILFPTLHEMEAAVVAELHDNHIVVL